MQKSELEMRVEKLENLLQVPPMRMFDNLSDRIRTLETAGSRPAAILQTDMLDNLNVRLSNLETSSTPGLMAEIAERLKALELERPAAAGTGPAAAAGEVATGLNPVTVPGTLTSLAENLSGPVLVPDKAQAPAPDFPFETK